MEQVEQAIIRPRRVRRRPQYDWSYDIIYFNVQGTAQPARYLLGYLGIQYEDKFLETNIDRKEAIEHWRDLDTYPVFMRKTTDFEGNIVENKRVEVIEEITPISAHLCNENTETLIPPKIGQYDCTRVYKELHGFLNGIMTHIIERCYNDEDDPDHQNIDPETALIEWEAANEANFRLSLKSWEGFLRKFRRYTEPGAEDEGHSGPFAFGFCPTWIDFWLGYVVNVVGSLFGPLYVMLDGEEFDCLRRHQNAFENLDAVSRMPKSDFLFWLPN